LSNLRNIKHLKTVTFNISKYYAWRVQFSIVFSENKLMEYVDSGKSLDDLICVQEDQLILE